MGASLVNGWPGQVIHVNEDGWVLINRGARHGVAPGMRLLVVGDGIRDLRDLSAGAAEGTAPVLRIRRTYELLEVIYAEDACAIAIAARAPAERRPSVYRGPAGELLVWTPLPPNYTYQLLAAEGEMSADAASEEETADTTAGEGAEEDADVEPAAGDGETDIAAEGGADGDDGDDGDDDLDMPPQLGEQEDKRWEEALPLNGTTVGDLVVPALPAIPGDAASLTTPLGHQAWAAPASSPGGDAAAPTPYDAGRSYDWMKPSGG